jgi:hypothetical protein
VHSSNLFIKRSRELLTQEIPDVLETVELDVHVKPIGDVTRHAEVDGLWRLSPCLFELEQSTSRLLKGNAEIFDQRHGRGRWPGSKLNVGYQLSLKVSIARLALTLFDVDTNDVRELLDRRNSICEINDSCCMRCELPLSFPR